jgi:hypothetical protein
MRMRFAVAEAVMSLALSVAAQKEMHIIMPRVLSTSR